MYGYQGFSKNFPLPVDFDIRESIHNTIHGSKNESPKGRWVVVQNLRRNANGDPIKSPFAFYNSQEGNHRLQDNASTTRTGYLCDEHWLRTIIIPSGRFALDEVQAPIGNLETNRIVFLVSGLDEHYPKQHDLIITPKIDIDGNILSPVTPDVIYVATLLYPKTLDNGRVEYYVIIAEKQF